MKCTIKRIIQIHSGVVAEDSGMSTTEKEWLRTEEEWLDQQAEWLQRLYGGDYIKWIGGETDPRAWLDHVASDVRDGDDSLQAKIALTRLRKGFSKATESPPVEEPAWVSVQCKRGCMQIYISLDNFDTLRCIGV